MLVSVKPNTYPAAMTSQKLVRTVKFSKLNRWADRGRKLLHRKCPIEYHHQPAHTAEPVYIREVVLVPTIAKEEEEEDPDRA
jgi:hypothetical protein